MALFEVRDIEKEYSDGTRALRGVTFDIKEGQFVAIMGPSGSGKSTLLHIIGFLDRQTKGNFHFGGKSIDDYTDEELAHVRNKKMGFIFQMFNLLPRTNVLENVQLPLVYSGVKERFWKEKAYKAIESVGLIHRIDKMPNELSGGERQRVAIARALVNDPQVIFADEPTGNLDSEAGEVVMEVLENLNNRGHTIVLVTHETYTAEYAERMILIQDGMVVSDKPVLERHSPHDNFKK